MAEENELGMREAMDREREGSSSIRSTGASSSAAGGINWAKDSKGGKDAVHSMTDVNWAKDDAERTAKATARQLKVPYPNLTLTLTLTLTKAKGARP